MKEYYEKVGARIKQARITRNISRTDLAIQAGISYKFLYEIEKGRKGFTVYVLNNIVEAIGVSFDYIMNEESRN